MRRRRVLQPLVVVAAGIFLAALLVFAVPNVLYLSGVIVPNQQVVIAPPSGVATSPWTWLGRVPPAFLNETALQEVVATLRNHSYPFDNNRNATLARRYAVSPLFN